MFLTPHFCHLVRPQSDWEVSPSSWALKIKGQREKNERDRILQGKSWWVPDKAETISVSHHLSGATCFLNACETDISRGRCLLTFLCYLWDILSGLISLSEKGLRCFQPDRCCRWAYGPTDNERFSQRPGCSTTCFCPLVIGKLQWIVWQTLNFHF